MKIVDQEALLKAVRRVLPFIDDAEEITTVFPDSAASKECREAVAELRQVLARIGDRS